MSTATAGRPALQPRQFIEKWKAVDLTERSAAHSHFLDLCQLLDEPAPTDVDPKGEWYCFERGATKTTGGEGWADVWKRGHFGWEYKGKRKDLNAAFAQLQQYALALENPPLLAVCDLERFRVHTNWTNTVSQVHEFKLDDLQDAGIRDLLKAVMSAPERLRPGKTRQALTEEAAAEFARLAQRLRGRGHDPVEVAHFVNRLIFCMFAEDVGLLPNVMFRRMLEAARHDPGNFTEVAQTLFTAMRGGGRVGFEHVAWFNGGLFDTAAALPLEKDEIALCLRAANLDWAEIDPSILGTLFERGLDPDKRSQLGAHYTDRDKIMRIIEPVIVRPLLAEWEDVKTSIGMALSKADAAKGAAARRKALNEAVALYRAFLKRLRAYRVLDPACGSGNFLYLALLALKDLEHRVGIEAEAMAPDLQREFPEIGPQCVLGIEINPYAAELARVSIWIGEIQWMRRNGFDVARNPILKSLDTIECRDALINEDGTEAAWPAADCIVGNPPFLGGKLLRATLTDARVRLLFGVYGGRVPAEADLVAYWFVKAWERVREGQSSRAGLVSTNSIRGGANRRVLEAIGTGGCIYEAWSDEPWVVDGAAVRVSIVCLAATVQDGPVVLDGVPVLRIHADLTATPADLTTARRLRENAGVAFMGDTKGGAFDISGDLAREWLALPLNPNGRSNAEVLRPWMNGMDVTRRPAGKWIVDFGWEMTVDEAALFEKPFAHILANVKPEREKNNREAYRRNWWRHMEPRPGMWSALKGLNRFIVTPEVSRHRVFAWMERPVVPDHKLQVIARDDDMCFGVLNSRFHRLWSVRVGSWHGVGNDPRYTISTCFETFPFPESLGPNVSASGYADNPSAQSVAVAANRLHALRQTWLNPPDLVRREPEVVPGFPDRLIARDAAAAAILKKRTLSNLYNERPTWLTNAHRALDEAVAAAYGWSVDLPDDEVLSRLLELNLSRSSRCIPR